MWRDHRKEVSQPWRSNLADRFSNSKNTFRRGLFRFLLVVVLAFLVYTFFGGTYGFVRITRLHYKINEINKANHQLLVRLIDAEYNRMRLQNDLNYIEYIARTKHLFTRPGEVIYRFKE
jgi:cell division protein FtsB